MMYFRSEIDKLASEIPEITDKPDLAISSSGRIIGVELSQFPSSYIIKNFHQKMPSPNYSNDIIYGHLNVYPFEPHRWVHEVLEKKSKNADTYKKRIKAHEMWLVMHCHSTTSEWPMSEGFRKKSREAELLLMRFGIKQHRASFERIFYVYADGEVVELTGLPEIPSTVMLESGAGYPAVTSHHFSFSCNAPLPGLGVHEYHFDKIQFDETIVPPKDDWMAQRDPDIERPNFTCSVRADSENMEWKIFQNSILIAEGKNIPNDKLNKKYAFYFIIEYVIKMTTFSYNA